MIQGAKKNVTYQAFVESQFQNALNSGLTSEQLDSECYKYALKQMLGVYAEAYQFDGYEIKFWKKDFYSKGSKGKNCFRGREIWRTLLGSKKAYELCEGIERGKSKETPYYEHIEPKILTYERLIKLAGTKKADAADIHETCKYNKLIILHRDEVKFLDSANYNKFTREDQELLKSWEKDGYITSDILNDALESMRSARSSKDGGTAYARFAHLCVKGVEFEWGRDPKPRVGKKPIELFKDYMNDDNREIT